VQIQELEEIFMDTKIKNITEWIKDQGYPLEMYCENLLSENSFNVIQSLHYEDEETKKYREIDILATKFKIHNNVTFNFSIVIECKLSKEKPWLLFVRKPHMDYKEEVLKDVFMTYNGRILVAKSTEIKSLSLLTINSEKIGFNLTQCFTSGKDIPYQALMSTINACEYLVRKSDSSTKNFCNFYFPVIVIDTDLYECQSTVADDITIYKVEASKLLTIRSYSDRSSILHSIVTKTGFKSFVESLSIEIESMISKMNAEFEHVSVTRPSNSNPHFTFI
jgi:hypothetical protein